MTEKHLEAVERARALCRDCRLDGTAALLAEVAAHLRSGGWLPIESCPPDLIYADLWTIDGEWSGRVTDCFKADGKWHDPVGCHGDAWPVEAVITHYRPLPAPPAALATPGEG